ncbi:MAG: hypothetical protein VYB17_02030 [Candidatus Thermoplasmatota archaeon]|nr:hypothetical protein [Candidatus Thermoplasmatota archaeon]
MTEEGPPNSEANEGLVFHEGSRLTDLKIKQNLSIDYPRLEPLHHLKIELMFHIFKIRNTWTMSHWTTLAIGLLAVILSGWDFGINEISNGGDFYSIGINPSDENSGIRSVSSAAVALSLISLGLWAIMLVRLWAIFPLMRSQAISLYVALLAAEISQFWAHGYDARYPFGGDSFAIAVSVVGLILIAFVGFILQRAVTETRDVHVEERHWHPDPRQVDIAKRDHSLIAWSVGLMAYCVVVVIHAWSGAHYVSVRQPDVISGWWILKMIHLLTGLLLVWLIVHILWYPQIMLGGAQIRIESDRARQVGALRQSVGDVPPQQTSRSGKCPDCGAKTTVQMHADGEIDAACAIDGCNGNGAPGEKCRVCGTRISSRVICNACNTSAPVGNHFANEEAW